MNTAVGPQDLAWRLKVLTAKERPETHRFTRITCFVPWPRPICRVIQAFDILRRWHSAPESVVEFNSIDYCLFLFETSERMIFLARFQTNVRGQPGHCSVTHVFQSVDFCLPSAQSREPFEGNVTWTRTSFAVRRFPFWSSPGRPNAEARSLQSFEQHEPEVISQVIIGVV